MSKGLKIFAFILSFVVLAGGGFCTVWTVINWDRVTEAMSGTALYNHDDLEEAYKDGYHSAVSNQKSYEAQINEHLGAIDKLNVSLARVNQANAELNQRIAALEAQGDADAATITALRETMTANQATVRSLETQIATKNDELDAIYAELGVDLEETDSSLVIMVFGDTLYSYAIVSNGCLYELPIPTSTPTKQFNGWRLDGDPVSGSVLVNGNLRFVADVTYYYTVQFMCDNTVIDTQILGAGEVPTEPAFTAPTGYALKYWTKDDSLTTGVAPVYADTTYTAVLTDHFTVTFMTGDERFATRQVLVGNRVSKPLTDPEMDGKVFRGWLLNGEPVDFATLDVTSDLTIVAHFEDGYRVTFLCPQDTNYNKTKMVGVGENAGTPPRPDLDNYAFVDWSVDGHTPVNVRDYPINRATTFVAIMEELTWTTIATNVTSSILSPNNPYWGAKYEKYRVSGTFNFNAKKENGINYPAQTITCSMSSDGSYWSYVHKSGGFTWSIRLEDDLFTYTEFVWATVENDDGWTTEAFFSCNLTIELFGIRTMTSTFKYGNSADWGGFTGGANEDVFSSRSARLSVRASFTGGANEDVFS